MVDGGLKIKSPVNIFVYVFILSADKGAVFSTSSLSFYKYAIRCESFQLLLQVTCGPISTVFNVTTVTYRQGFTRKLH